MSASCLRSAGDWKVCPVGYTLPKSSMIYSTWLKRLSLICTIALLIYSPLIYMTFAGNPPPDLYFTCSLKSSLPAFFSPIMFLVSFLFHLPSFICLLSSSSLSLPLFYFPSISSLFSSISPLPASLPSCSTAANKSTRKAQKPQKIQV